MDRRALSAVALMLVSSCFVLAVASAGAGQRPFKAMFNFGDSLGDTGNICVNKSAASQLDLTVAHPPYGMTYFGRPTCRCSDGRLVVDFLAQELGLPLLPPSKLRGADFAFFESVGLGYPLWNNGAMSIQIRWFRDLLPSICGGAPEGPGCRNHLSRSLFVFGPFGANDYNAMVFFGFTVDQARNYTPRIVDTIAAGVEQLIELGAVDIVVPGALPVGCFALYLTFLPSSDPADYDEHGCLKSLNELSMYQNALLQSRLAVLQARYGSSARIAYADYYTQIYGMVRSPARFGFSAGAVPACCGAGGGRYNFEFDARCGMAGATACRDLSRHESWDGVHPTEAVNRQVAEGWLRGPYCHPPILLH